jgi:hypothetical protein
MAYECALMAADRPAGALLDGADLAGLQEDDDSTLWPSGYRVRTWPAQAIASDVDDDATRVTDP